MAWDTRRPVSVLPLPPPLEPCLGAEPLGSAHSWVYILRRATALSTSAILEREPIASYINQYLTNQLIESIASLGCWLLEQGSKV